MPKKEMKTRFSFPTAIFFLFPPNLPFLLLFYKDWKMSMTMGNSLNQTKVEERELKKRKKESKNESYVGQ